MSWGECACHVGHRLFRFVPSFCSSFLFSSVNLLDVGQRPRLVEQRFCWSIEAEHHLELASRIRGNPVRLFPLGSLWTQVEIDRTVLILFHFSAVRRAASAIDVLDERMGL